MNEIPWLILIVIIILAIAVISAFTSRKNVKSEKQFTYFQKPFLTESEKKFLDLMKPLEKYGLIIIPQVNLASIIKKDGNTRYNTELFRNIDFGIFDKNYDVKLLIELNDATHNEKKRKYRDARVREITKIAKISFLTFYTNKPNRQDYVLHRIIEKLEEEK